MIEDGKLWKVILKGASRAPKVECVTSAEGKEIAKEIHAQSGHFGRDMTKLKVMQTHFWPRMNTDIRDVV